MNQRNQSLDVLRGIAVLMVTGHHFGYYKTWERFGGMGVDLFFVLSGYLISGLLFAEHRRTGTINFTRFLIRRGFKIYPAYFVMVLVFPPFTFRSVTWADFTFMGAYFPVLWGHGWSLSVEEHFYLALPLVLLASARILRSRNFAWIPFAMPAVCVICLVLRYRYALDHSVLYGIAQTHMRIDSLFAGVTLGWFQHFHPKGLSTKRSYLFGLSGLGAITPVFFMSSSPVLATSVGYLCLTAGFSMILMWALNSDWIGRLRPIAKIGFYSYSIYLWHWAIALIFLGTLGSTFVGFWIYVGVCIFLGIVMAKVIEIPVLKVRERLFPSASRTFAVPLKEAATGLSEYRQASTA